MKLGITKDLIERMGAVGDKHDRIISEMAIEEIDEAAAELARLRAVAEAAKKALQELKAYYKENDLVYYVDDGRVYPNPLYLTILEGLGESI